VEDKVNEAALVLALAMRDRPDLPCPVCSAVSPPCKHLLAMITILQAAGEPLKSARKQTTV